VARPRRSTRTLTTLVVLVLVSVSIITLGERGGSRLTSSLKSGANTVFDPVRNGLDDALRPVGNFFAGAVHYGAVVQENNKLRYTIGKLRQAQAAAEYEARQARQLLTLANLPFVGALPVVTAQTQAVNTSNFAATIQIDKGRDEGVATGMPVVGSGGLVGQVVESYPHIAFVRLITDGQSKVGVTFGNPPNPATVNGEGPGRPLTADFVLPGTPVGVGEVMYTNGLAASEYPPGIPVARITSATTEPGASQISITARPLADLDHLAYVDVVLWLPTP
jgi:rod shape-determining protein MreC